MVEQKTQVEQKIETQMKFEVNAIQESGNIQFNFGPVNPSLEDQFKESGLFADSMWKPSVKGVLSLFTNHVERVNSFLANRKEQLTEFDPTEPLFSENLRMTKNFISIYGEQLHPSLQVLF